MRQSGRVFCLAWCSNASALLAGASLVAACSISPGANPATRCETQRDCAEAQTCHAGFCIDDGSIHEQSDPASVPEAGPGSEVGFDAGNASDGSSTNRDGGHPGGDTPGSTTDGDGANNGDDGSQDGEPTVPDEPTDDGSDDDGVSGDGTADTGSDDGAGSGDDQEEDDQGRDDDQGNEDCGNACNGNRICMSGTCCKADESVCSGECVKLDKDKHNCGSCGNVCGHGPCKDGMCQER